jgi:hypothetical protein
MDKDEKLDLVADVTLLSALGFGVVLASEFLETR